MTEPPARQPATAAASPPAKPADPPPPAPDPPTPADPEREIKCTLCGLRACWT